MRLTDFLKNHIAGIFIFSVATGFFANWLYDHLKTTTVPREARASSGAAGEPELLGSVRAPSTIPPSPGPKEPALRVEMHSPTAVQRVPERPGVSERSNEKADPMRLDCEKSCYYAEMICEAKCGQRDCNDAIRSPEDDCSHQHALCKHGCRNDDLVCRQDCR